MPTAQRLDGRACDTIPSTDALSTALFGDVVVVPGALRASGYLAAVTEVFVDELAEVTSPSVAEAVREAGVERLHDHVDAHDVARLLARLDERLRPLAVPLARSIVERITDDKPRFFICGRVWVRALVPYRLVAPHADLLASQHLVGHLLPADPHRDFWLTHPRGTISLFGAIGPVRSDNGVAVYDDDDPHEHFTPELAPGDVLVLNADRLHGSVRNTTDETRVAVTCRVVVGRLRYGPGTHWQPYYDSRLLGTPFERFAAVRSKLTRAALRRWRARRAWQRGVRDPLASIA